MQARQTPPWLQGVCWFLGLNSSPGCFPPSPPVFASVKLLPLPLPFCSSLLWCPLRRFMATWVFLSLLFVPCFCFAQTPVSVLSQDSTHLWAATLPLPPRQVAGNGIRGDRVGLRCVAMSAVLSFNCLPCKGVGREAINHSY